MPSSTTATATAGAAKAAAGVFHLSAAGLLPGRYRVIGPAPASSALTDEQLREHARQAVAESGITKPAPYLPMVLR